MMKVKNYELTVYIAQINIFCFCLKTHRQLTHLEHGRVAPTRIKKLSFEGVILWGHRPHLQCAGKAYANSHLFKVIFGWGHINQSWLGVPHVTTRPLAFGARGVAPLPLCLLESK